MVILEVLIWLPFRYWDVGSWCVLLYAFSAVRGSYIELSLVINGQNQQCCVVQRIHINQSLQMKRNIQSCTGTINSRQQKRKLSAINVVYPSCARGVDWSDPTASTNVSILLLQELAQVWWSIFYCCWTASLAAPLHLYDFVHWLTLLEFRKTHLFAKTCKKDNKTRTERQQLLSWYIEFTCY